ncbi:hypothetical protein [Arthrobacter sp. B1805]|uniref:hypothetical protein n=1 Tax=Arthrobacter sp. B1805 TaxID=2058892 RepID=UPI000CE3EBFF|nr:hypothetical protein [Arthrobacter sp. B1805]
MTLALIVFGAAAVTWQPFAALVAAAGLGIWLFRFGSRQAWAALLVLAGTLAVLFLLAGNSEVIRSVPVAWIFGFAAGSNFGVAWRMTARKPAALSTAR